MPSWNDLLNEIRNKGSTHDATRRKYLRRLAKLTGRNVIVYYSGWLQKEAAVPMAFSLTDNDKNGFMAAVHGLERAKGLDLILHTPGGDAAATESLVDYLRAMFGADIRAIIPQLAMSAGTMIACAAKTVVMGKHSSLGPIDPQVMGVPAHGVIEEYKNAMAAAASAPHEVPIHQVLLSKYEPTMIGECEKAIKWADEMVSEWLRTGMFAGDPECDPKVARVMKELGDHALTKSHGRHISAKRAAEMGLNITPLESDPDLQDAVLSVHHACTVTLSDTAAAKIIENQRGVAFISVLNMPNQRQLRG